MAEYKIDIYKIPDSAKSTEITTDKITSGEIPLSSDSTFSSLTSTSNLILSVSISKQNQNVTLKTGTNEESKDTLLSVDYLKKMYEPGWMQIKLQLGTRSSSADLKEKFSDCIVNLSVDDYMVARNYYIFQVRPEYKKESESTSCHVFLTAYSPDKFLTLDTYSRAYTCKRPFEDILGNTLVNFKDKNSFARFIGLTEKATNNLLHMKVDAGTFILPYSVQYNESFYDFLVRLANRNGEFLYWDQGQLQMGLPSSTTSTVISVYEGVTFENPTFEVGDNTTPIRSIATDKDLTDEKNETSMLNPSEVANEEYWATISKDGYVGFDDLMTAPVIVSSLIGILSEPDLFSMILSAGSKIAVTLAQNAIQGSDNKKKWNETYFSDEMKNKNSRQYNDSKEMYSPFSHYVKPEELVTQVGKGFYQDIRKGEQKMDASRMQVKCTGCYNIALGDRFTIDSDTTKIDSDTTKYVSIQIEGHVSTGNETWNLTGIPDEDYPITSSKGWVRKSEPQTAFVVSTDDPLRMGRIRIKYLWQTNAQTETDGEYDMTDASPWIRMSTPMASKESGFFFLPTPGDEVLISYENGNVERPYMTGALHNQRRKPYDGDTNQTITSHSGHQIAFTDGSAMAQIGGAGFNILSTLTDFLPQLAGPMAEIGKEGEGRKFAGGITMTDPYHFYSISMSTDERSVTIDSPLGSVELNAFTGINICAPNGNLYLQGKNITLEAGNKVEIRSGLNISRSRKESLMRGLDWLKLKLKEYVCDLTLLRTLVETLLKPIDGTLRIGSKRYLCLEAGEGEAKVLDPGRYKDHWLTNTGRLFLGMGNKNVYAMHIKNLDGCVQTCLKELAEKSNKIIKARNAYQAKWQNLVASVSAFTEDNWKVDVKAIRDEGKKDKGTLPALANVATYFSTTNSNANNNANQNASQTQQPVVTQADLEKLRKALFDAVAAVGNFDEYVKTQLKAKGLDEALYDKFKTGHLYADKVAAFNVLKKSDDDFITDGLITNKTVPAEVRQEVIKATLGSLMKDFSLTYNDTPINTQPRTWEQVVDTVDYAPTQTTTTTNNTSKWKKVLGPIGDFASESVGLNGFRDQYTWQGANKGDILFSSKKDETFYLTKDKTIDSYTVALPDLDDIKKALRAIK